MRDRILYFYVRHVAPLRERGEGAAAYIIALGVAAAILLPILGLVLSGGIGGVGNRLKAFLDSLSFSTGP